MNLVTVAIQTLLGAALILGGLAATFRPRWLEPLFSKRPPTGIRRFVMAVLLWVAGLASLIGIVVPFAAFFASCLAFVTSVTWALLVARSKAVHVWLLPVLLIISAVTVAVAQPLGLKVLALPKADDLPFEPVRASVVKTYDEGLWLEGIASAADGTLYVAGNRGLEFSRSDYYRGAQGELIARKPDGEERVIFKTPRGSTAGVVAVDGQGVLYLTSHGDESTIWRIDAQGSSKSVGQFPSGAWPNGLDIGPDGMLYTPDSHLGVIWRVNPKTGETHAAISDSALLARPFIALAPGANGLHFSGRDMIVTVSDKTTVLKYAMDDQGRFGKPTVIARGIPGDDFAIGHDGSLFITTHPYDTVVRVSPTGQRTIIGKAAQHIVGATDAVFGTSQRDRDTLYVVTDGGAFTGGPKMRGQLVALQPYDSK